MWIKENLTVNEATDYAENIGYDSVMFRINLNDKYIASGKFLDAYYDLIQIPVLVFVIILLIYSSKFANKTFDSSEF